LIDSILRINEIFKKVNFGDTLPYHHLTTSDLVKMVIFTPFEFQK